MKVYSRKLLGLVFTLICIVITIPIIVIISLLLYITTKGDIIFKQQRSGIEGKPFYLYKFRTMTTEKDKNGDLLPDEMRITFIGAWLRKTSLDELPSLMNVIQGEMSIVGPRPLLMEYIPLYSDDQLRRHEVKPGITGWAQINGRNSITWEEKFKLDVWYVDNQSLWIDIKIIFFTLFKVLKQNNISYSGHATMPKFTGKLNE